MRGRICVAMLFGAILCSESVGQQMGSGIDWVNGLSDNINWLNRNIQQNVQRIHQQVNDNLEQAMTQGRRFSDNLSKQIAAASGNSHSFSSGSTQTFSSGNVLVTDNDGTRLVQSGRTSDGRQYIRESTDKLEGDMLRHVDRIYDPATNTTRVYGYILNLKDHNAKPVLIEA
ncbi:uncharacterized protein LOC128875642 isoform X1 [Hylaeus volcanicus]|uniref:uncharacterized protein LOC128875642 isoform X1 n=1 Tax=Hylaeus volcanicus TaxID=313075 RepID=UPI0023B7C1BB|nr:uncharacterized protein LOC128875642 isoform X1 [Hylaeus volcanicus]